VFGRVRDATVGGRFLLLVVLGGVNLGPGAICDGGRSTTRKISAISRRKNGTGGRSRRCISFAGRGIEGISGATNRRVLYIGNADNRGGRGRVNDFLFCRSALSVGAFLIAGGEGCVGGVDGGGLIRVVLDRAGEGVVIVNSRNYWGSTRGIVDLHHYVVVSFGWRSNRCRLRAGGTGFHCKGKVLSWATKMGMVS